MIYTATFKDDSSLTHWGVKGQKWGERRYQNSDGTLTPEGKERYSSEQYSRDKRVYGNSGAKRIQKKVNNGESVSGARSSEADRIQTARRSARVAGNVGSVVSGAAGAVGGAVLANHIVKKYGDNATAKTVASLVGSTAGATVGGILGRYGSQSLSMAISGYSPSKYR